MSVNRQDAIEPLETSQSREMQPELAIHHVVELRIDQEVATQRRSTDEHRRLTNGVESADEHPGRGGWYPEDIENIAVRVHASRMTVDKADVRLGVKGVHHSGDDIAREVGVVRVEPSDDLAGRPCER